MAILNFSNQTFKVEQIANITVDDLVRLAQQNQPRLFVVHDSVQKTSAVVIPELVLAVVNKLQLPAQQRAVDVGLMGVVRGCQITGKSDQPAGIVAYLANVSRADFVIVTDEQRTPAGLFIPGVVAQRLPEARMVQDMPDLRQEILQRLAVNDLTGALQRTEKRIKDFHSEKVNLDAPDPYICAGDEEDGPHHRNSCPCPV